MSFYLLEIQMQINQLKSKFNNYNEKNTDKIPTLRIIHVYVFGSQTFDIDKQFVCTLVVR